MNQLLIGLAGRARTGKTTAANHLENDHRFQSYAFADPLREGLMTMFNLCPYDFEGAQKEKSIEWLDRSPRELMQSLGTEWGRNLVHPELWLLLAEQNLEFLGEIHEAATGFVISDLRFENEAQFVRDRGGVVIHLYRPSAPEVNAHVSEDGIRCLEQDLMLANYGTEEELFRNLDSIVALLRARAVAA